MTTLVRPGASAPESLSSTPTAGFRSSGSSPPRPATVHLLGAGKVGCALLRGLDRARYRIVGVSDSRATVFAREGLDGAALARRKEAGGALADDPGAEALPTEIALGLIAADVVVDATPTDLARADAKKALVERALGAGSRVALAAKDAAVAAAPVLAREPWRSRVGLDAALGGTGFSLRRELEELRAECVSVALVANVATTALVLALEAGESWEGALARVASRGLLESDPESDWSGADAAAKLAIVAGALRGEPIDPRGLAVDARALDPELLRRRRARGRTTRLVARHDAERGASLAFEELSCDSPLAASDRRVVYAYELRGGALRLHVGAGVGPEATARAIVRDLDDLTAGGAR